MGLLNGVMIFEYMVLFTEQQSQDFYIVRTRRDIQFEENFKTYTVNVKSYFLYNNKSDLALDAIDSRNKLIYQYEDVAALCQLDLDQIEFKEQPDKLSQLRSNRESLFINASEIFVLILMTVCTLFNTFYIPLKLKEYQIPLIFRNSDTNKWFDK